MAEYERSRFIRAPRDDVFAFVTDVRNLPTFVPTVTAAEPRPENRVRIRGEINGVSFEDDGWFDVDADRQRMEWSADEHDYSGWMVVGVADVGTQVVAHLTLPPFVTSTGRPVEGEVRETPDPIEQSLEASLDSLRNLMEGTGGKVQPTAATRS